MCSRLYYLGLCKYALWRSHKDEIAKRRISQNVSPSLSDAPYRAKKKYSNKSARTRYNRIYSQFISKWHTSVTVAKHRKVWLPWALPLHRSNLFPLVDNGTWWREGNGGTLNLVVFLSLYPWFGWLDRHDLSWCRGQQAACSVFSSDTCSFRCL